MRTTRMLRISRPTYLRTTSRTRAGRPAWLTGIRRMLRARGSTGIWGRVRGGGPLGWGATGICGRMSRRSPLSWTSSTGLMSSSRARNSSRAPLGGGLRMCAMGDEGGVRLQKVLARAGVASRRNAELLIEEGRVEVDGRVVTEFGVRVDPEVAVIRVDGERIPPVSANVYLVFTKPRGVVTTMSDPQGRPCIAEYVQDRPERLFHIGRLDTDTEGLLLLTNHGEFAHRLAHPSYEVSKTYVAEVDGNVKPAVLRRLTDGLTLEDGFAQADTVREMTSIKGRTLIQMT